ncbi:hypothetical protein LTR66_007907 [Elasticomyces elasticus]|nr:hypothetical protein LTR66_007907 [Elasticomyces elasticus]
MAPSGSSLVGDDYFNDLSQQPLQRPVTERSNSGEAPEENGIPKVKRIACVLCRKRKLRCDGTKPSCGTCTRLARDCSYDEVRRKSGPKRGYVKALEARLAQVETMLKTQDSTEQPANASQSAPSNDAQPELSSMVPEYAEVDMGGNNIDMTTHVPQVVDRYLDPPQGQFSNTALNTETYDMPYEEPLTWEMIGLGLDEPLPNQDFLNELNQVYFDKIHPSIPMIHRPRFFASMNLAPHMRPPVCLRYAMWCLAAAVTDKYDSLQDHFYQRARKYLHQDEMKGHGEFMSTVAHAQTWLLVSSYEFKMMYFPRAWVSTGRATRMVQMLGLHRIDGIGLDVKQCLPPSDDWTETEERRRTFWTCFCNDRYASIGTGWPMTIDEKDISTNLPVDEESFEKSKPSPSTTLQKALESEGSSQLSSYAGVIVMACLFGRNLTHLHRPGPDDRDHDLDGDFWKRHRNMDTILLNTALSLPDHLRLPMGISDPNVVFLNMNIHTSTICLHQAAIFKADTNRMPSKISAESKIRCVTAAAEIASIMRIISHQDLSLTNPFLAFCLYVAARVFVQYLKSRPRDEQVKTSLLFLLSAMQALRRKNPLTESFLIQLDVDLEGAGLEDLRMRLATQTQAQTARAPRNTRCSVLGSGSQNDPQTYGNSGLASHTAPNMHSSSLSPPERHTDNPYAHLTDMADPAPTAFAYSLQQDATFSLPSRQKTPLNINYSPPNSSQDMDTSPDGSNSLPTPPTTSSTYHKSSNASSTKRTSPPNQNESQRQNPYQRLDRSSGSNNSAGGAFFSNNNTAYLDPTIQFFSNANVDPLLQQDAGFVLPDDWSMTGLDPQSAPDISSADSFAISQDGAVGGTGLTLEGVGILTMSDAEWDQVLKGFDVGWNDLELDHGVDVLGRKL